jgi:phosphatidylinositol-bisphosphatase
VGTQECENSFSKSIFNPAKDNWERCCADVMGQDYEMIRGHALQTSHLVVFVHKSIHHLVTNVESHAVATGICDTLGNKGGIGISLAIGKSSFCFLCAHLAAHQNQMDRRTVEFAKISREVSFVLGSRTVRTESNGADKEVVTIGDTVQTEYEEDVFSDDEYDCADKRYRKKDVCKCFCSLAARSTSQCSLCCKPGKHEGCINPLLDAFDFVFWAGDMNFRIHGTRNVIDSLLENDRHDVLVDNDQLTMLMQFEPTFSGFAEGPLTFRPTYKFDKGVDIYDTSEKRRIPAWTDRVLYKKHSQVEQLSYFSARSIRTSDHRPVYASFRCTLDLDNDQIPSTETSVLRSESKSEVCVIS